MSVGDGQSQYLRRAADRIAAADALPRDEANRLLEAQSSALEAARGAHDREHELHDIRHESEHAATGREHHYAEANIEKSLAALRDEMRGTRETHFRMHAQEAEALAIALSAGDRLRDEQKAAHEREHAAHVLIHTQNQDAVKTALASVDRERTIHAEAHEREHRGHLVIHDLAQLAVGKAEVSVEDRLKGVNEFRAQLRDQQATFATRDAMEAMQKEIDRRFNDAAVQTAAHFVATEKLTQDRFESNRNAIVALKETDIKGEGKSLGQGAVVAAIIATVGFAATLLGLIVVVANLLTGS